MQYPTVVKAVLCIMVTTYYLIGFGATFRAAAFLASMISAYRLAADRNAQTRTSMGKLVRTALCDFEVVGLWSSLSFHICCGTIKRTVAGGRQPR